MPKYKEYQDLLSASEYYQNHLRNLELIENRLIQLEMVEQEHSSKRFVGAATQFKRSREQSSTHLVDSFIARVGSWKNTDPCLEEEAPTVLNIPREKVIRPGAFTISTNLEKQEKFYKSFMQEIKSLQINENIPFIDALINRRDHKSFWNHLLIFNSQAFKNLGPIAFIALSDYLVQSYVADNLPESFMVYLPYVAAVTSTFLSVGFNHLSSKVSLTKQQTELITIKYQILSNWINICYNVGIIPTKPHFINSYGKKGASTDEENPNSGQDHQHEIVDLRKMSVASTANIPVDEKNGSGSFSDYKVNECDDIQKIKDVFFLLRRTMLNLSEQGKKLSANEANNLSLDILNSALEIAIVEILESRINPADTFNFAQSQANSIADLLTKKIVSSDKLPSRESIHEFLFIQFKHLTINSNISARVSASNNVRANIMEHDPTNIFIPRNCSFFEKDIVERILRNKGTTYPSIWSKLFWNATSFVVDAAKNIPIFIAFTQLVERSSTVLFSALTAVAGGVLLVKAKIEQAVDVKVSNIKTSTQEFNNTLATLFEAHKYQKMNHREPLVGKYIGFTLDNDNHRIVNDHARNYEWKNQALAKLPIAIARAFATKLDIRSEQFFFYIKEQCDNVLYSKYISALYILYKAVPFSKFKDQFADLCQNNPCDLGKINLYYDQFCGIDGAKWLTEQSKKCSDINIFLDHVDVSHISDIDKGAIFYRAFSILANVVVNHEMIIYTETFKGYSEIKDISKEVPYLGLLLNRHIKYAVDANKSSIAGVFGGKNFIINHIDWDRFRQESIDIMTNKPGWQNQFVGLGCILEEDQDMMLGQ